MWVYRAEDEDGCILAESYNEMDLIAKVYEEFGRMNFRIARYFNGRLKKMWVYRAEDEDGRILAESDNEMDLIAKVCEEFGGINYRIVRYFNERLK